MDVSWKRKEHFAWIAEAIGVEPETILAAISASRQPETWTVLYGGILPGEIVYLVVVEREPDGALRAKGEPIALDGFQDELRAKVKDALGHADD